MSIFTAPFGFLYVPGTLIVTDNAAAAADNIRSSEWLLRLGIARELVGQISSVFVVLTFFTLFKSVHEHRARLPTVLGALVVDATSNQRLSIIADGVAVNGHGPPNFIQLAASVDRSDGSGWCAS